MGGVWEGGADGDAPDVAGGVVDGEPDGAALAPADGTALALADGEPDAATLAAGDAMGGSVGSGVMTPPLPRNSPLSRIRANTTATTTTKIADGRSWILVAISDTVGAVSLCVR